MGGDETVISADDTVISVDDTVLAVPVEETVIEPTQPQRRITDSPAFVARPTAVFSVRLVSGARYSLTSAVVVGRAPRVAKRNAGDVVQLVSVTSGDGRVSATHVELKQVGDVVVVTDLRSTNGTRVTSPGGAIRQLAPGDSMSLGEGSVVDIGDGNRIDILRETPRDASNGLAR